jgi:AcrR family transcriptional regulator
MTERATDLRERIVRAAAELLVHGGREAVSTRAVSAAAGVQAPAIYRQFGDMRGLLHAAAREVLAKYVRQKATRKPGNDPLEDLRRGWDVHVAFGLANPAAYALLYGDSAAEAEEPEVRDGYAVLQALVTRVAEAGRLRVSVAHAARLLHAGGCGVTLSLLASPPAERDLRLSDAMREAVLAAITVAPAPQEAQCPEPSTTRVAARAVALRAVLAEANDALSPGEQQLLGEWLDRLANADAR